MNFNFQVSDLYDNGGLCRLDQVFKAWLAPELTTALLALQANSDAYNPRSDILLTLAVELEHFIAHLFELDENDLSLIHQDAQQARIIYNAKRQFVIREALARYSSAAALAETDADDLVAQIAGYVYELNVQLETGNTLPAINNPLVATAIAPAEHPSQYQMAQALLHWLAAPEQYSTQLALAYKYVAWAVLTPAGRQRYQDWELFWVPQRLDYSSLIAYQPVGAQTFSQSSSQCSGQELSAAARMFRDGFNCIDPGPSGRYALDQANYCLICHHRGKDSCSTGLRDRDDRVRINTLGNQLNGCPLQQKISEMHELKAKGYNIAALAVITVDNPMVAVTGHRICNDCSKACIFQHQTPVDTPGVETQILDAVLELPWGFEIYSLLTRWNPLRWAQPLPLADTDQRVLVVGMGPAGFTLAHYLLNYGHTVVGIDGLDIEPLAPALLDLTRPIKYLRDYFLPLEQRPVSGFGGVAEYGITVRWDKNRLLLVRLLLERRRNFYLRGNLRLGSNLTLAQGFQDYGFKHISLCLGAGQPYTLKIPGISSKGVKLAAEFLFTLQAAGAYKFDTVANLAIRLPVVIIGSGLTAVDAATEALAYYVRYCERMVARIEKLCGQQLDLQQVATVDLSHFAPEEQEQLRTVLDHGLQIRTRRRQLAPGEKLDVSDLLDQWGGAMIIYHRSLIASAAYRVNHHELASAMAQGVRYYEHAEVIAINSDAQGQVCSITVRTPADHRVADAIKDNVAASDSTYVEQLIAARTVLIAIGTKPNHSIVYDLPEAGLKIEKGFLQAEQPGSVFCENIYGRQTVSYLGDLHPLYAGSVVKAMASAKAAAPQIHRYLLEVGQVAPPDSNPRLPTVGQSLADHIITVQNIVAVRDNYYELSLKAPAAARNFRPGQFFRLQLKGKTETIALSPSAVSPETGIIKLGVGIKGFSTQQLHWALTNNNSDCRLAVMGPIGKPLGLSQYQNILALSDSDEKAALLQPILEYVRAHGINAELWCSYQQLFVSKVKDNNRSQKNIAYDCVLVAVAPEVLPQVRAVLLEQLDGLASAGPEIALFAHVYAPMQCMMEGICACCVVSHHTTNLEGQVQIRSAFSCAEPWQNLRTLDVQGLQYRLRQNQIEEKLIVAAVGKQSFC